MCSLLYMFKPVENILIDYIFLPYFKPTILKGISLQELEEFITTHGYEKYKANQVYTWLYKQAQFDTNSMTNLSSKFKTFLNEKTILNTL